MDTNEIAIYDDLSFFDNYIELRNAENNYNDLIEQPIVFNLIGDVKNKYNTKDNGKNAGNIINYKYSCFPLCLYCFHNSYYGKGNKYQCAYYRSYNNHFGNRKRKQPRQTADSLHNSRPKAVTVDCFHRLWKKPCKKN